jgi:cation-transporting ATPase E
MDQEAGDRPDPEPAAVRAGLSAEQVAGRRAAGQGNVTADVRSRSVASIVRANSVTRFNAVVAVLAAVVLALGDPIDASFALVAALNSTVGVVQEVRAKRKLDSVRVLLVPAVTVIRDGRVQRVPPRELVVDDVFRVEPGDQVPVDGVVLESTGLEVDESALTGESLPVRKAVAARLLSGSSVVAGTAEAVAVRVGADSWAQQLTADARTFTLTRSELRVGIDRLLQAVGWLLVPLAALLTWSQLRGDGRRPDELGPSLVAAVAGVEALVPQGLVLLVSMSMAIAVIRLAGRKVVVQELSAVEGLARVDTLCLDKTGTLTTGQVVVDRIVPLPPGPGPGTGTGVDRLETALRSFLAVPALRSATLDALTPALPGDGDGGHWSPAATVAFSSERKWSGARFDSHGTWIVGAPEILLDAMAVPAPSAPALSLAELRALRERVDELAGRGRRVLLVARSSGASGDEAWPGAGRELPAGLVPVGLVTLKEEVRPDAADTLRYFRRQGVAVKVISGDNPRTVAAVGAELGLEAVDRTADLRTVAGPEALAALPTDTVVFGRVRPEHKRDLIRLLQARGHTVAMTGDGVNDIPSLKAADIGIAMNTAAPATRAVAQLVLLDGRFDRLPGVVAEGRRVIANMERVSSLFVTKTVYAAVFALVIGVTGLPFPFLPRHLSVIGTLTIGIPGFVLSFRSSSRPCRPGYLDRVLRFAVPAGLAAAGATLAAYGLVRTPVGGNLPVEEARTAASITLTLAGLWILYRLTRPLDRLEAVLLAGLTASLAALLAPSPLSRLYLLPLPGLRPGAVIATVLAVSAVGLEVATRRLNPEAKFLPGTVGSRPSTA